MLSEVINGKIFLNPYCMTTYHYPVTRNTLAKIYKVTPATFTDWLRDIGITHIKTLSPKDLRKIIESYDLPEGVEIKI